MTEQFNLLLAREERDKGIRRVAVNSTEFLKVARAVARQIAYTTGAVTSDDVRRLCEIEPQHHNAWGAVFKSKDFEWTGRYKQSEMVQRHGAMQRVWRLVPPKD